MGGVGSYIAGLALTIVGMSGLFLASSTHDPTFYKMGLLMFVFACGLIFAVIKHVFDDGTKTTK
jgi:hypothetical protein